MGDPAIDDDVRFGLIALQRGVDVEALALAIEFRAAGRGQSLGRTLVERGAINEHDFQAIERERACGGRPGRVGVRGRRGFDHDPRVGIGRPGTSGSLDAGGLARPRLSPSQGWQRQRPSRFRPGFDPRRRDDPGRSRGDRGRGRGVGSGSDDRRHLAPSPPSPLHSHSFPSHRAPPAPIRARLALSRPRLALSRPRLALRPGRRRLRRLPTPARRSPCSMRPRRSPPRRRPGRCRRHRCRQRAGSRPG